MKRSITICIAAILALSCGVGGCSNPADAPTRSAPETAGWILPPSIETVVRDGRSLKVRGRTAPSGRVVLRSLGNTAYAVSADDEGLFEIPIVSPIVDTLFVIEAQWGQVGVPAPYRMLVSADPLGPIALLSPGSNSRRLDTGPVLDAVDSDGQSLALSGRSAPGATVTVSIGERSVDVVVDSSGRWTTLVDSGGTGPKRVRVGTTDFLYPGGQELEVEAGRVLLGRVGDGWMAHWSASATPQVSWFPSVAG